MTLRKDWLECCNASLAVVPLPPDESPDMHYEDDSPYPLDGAWRASSKSNLLELFVFGGKVSERYFVDSQEVMRCMRRPLWSTWRLTGCICSTKWRHGCHTRSESDDALPALVHNRRRILFTVGDSMFYEVVTVLFCITTHFLHH